MRIEVVCFSPLLWIRAKGLIKATKTVFAKDVNNNIVLAKNGITGKVTVQLTNGYQLGVVGRLSVVFGFGGKDMKILKTTESPYAADLAAISTIYVCCNIVQPQIVTDANTQFLKSIPVKGTFGDTIAKPFKNIQYVHVQRKSFEDVEIILKSDTGGSCHVSLER